MHWSGRLKKVEETFFRVVTLNWWIFGKFGIHFLYFWIPISAVSSSFLLRNGIQKKSHSKCKLFCYAFLERKKKSCIYLSICIKQSTRFSLRKWSFSFKKYEMRKMSVVTVFIFLKVKKVKSTVVKFLIKIRLQIWFFTFWIPIKKLQKMVVTFWKIAYSVHSPRDHSCKFVFQIREFENRSKFANFGQIRVFGQIREFGPPNSRILVLYGKQVHNA